MSAPSSQDRQRSARRRRLLKGLAIGGAAIGLPALFNVWVRSRAGRLPPLEWGRPRRFAWEYGEVAFQQLGDGEPIVLLHSFGPGHDAAEWRRLSELLGRRFRIYALDMLGWGHSDKPRMTYDGELYIQLVQDFLQDVVGGRAVLGASGLSAAYAAQLAADRPELVRALALVCPMGLELHGEEPDLKDALLHRLMRLPVLGTSVLNVYTSRNGIASHLRQVYAAQERVDAALIQHHYRASHEPGAHGALAAYLAGYLNHNVEHALARLSLPTWIAWGRQARSPVVESSDQWLRRLPSARLEVFEGCGSQPHAEAPSLFSRKLENFLDERLSGDLSGDVSAEPRPDDSDTTPRS